MDTPPADEPGSRKNLPPLCIAQILAWADAHRACHGRWPKVLSGPVDTAPGETWAGVESALQHSTWGLLRRSSLARLLTEQRGAGNARGARRGEG